MTESKSFAKNSILFFLFNTINLCLYEITPLPLTKDHGLFLRLVILSIISGVFLTTIFKDKVLKFIFFVFGLILVFLSFLLSYKTIASYYNPLLTQGDKEVYTLISYEILAVGIIVFIVALIVFLFHLFRQGFK
jgi:hypothetical protein